MIETETAARLAASGGPPARGGDVGPEGVRPCDWSRTVATMFGTPPAARNALVRERGSQALRARFLPLIEPP